MYTGTASPQSMMRTDSEGAGPRCLSSLLMVTRPRCCFNMFLSHCWSAAINMFSNFCCYWPSNNYFVFKLLLLCIGTCPLAVSAAPPVSFMCPCLLYSLLKVLLIMKKPKTINHHYCLNCLVVAQKNVPRLKEQLSLSLKMVYNM